MEDETLRFFTISYVIGTATLISCWILMACVNKLPHKAIDSPWFYPALFTFIAVTWPILAPIVLADFYISPVIRWFKRQ